MIAAPLIAHRGCSLLRPENTLASLRHTAEIGVTWVEVDANLLGDETVVVFHDDYLDRLTPAKGPLREVGWAEVRDLDIGSHFSPAYADERMPRLQDVLVECDRIGLGLNLELKVYPHFSAQAIAEASERLLQRHWRQFDRLIISSFSVDALRTIRQLQPTWQLGLLCGGVLDDWRQIAAELNLVSIHCHYLGARPEVVSAIREQGLDIYTYTVNDSEVGEALWASGVDGLITDNPLLFERP